MVFKEPYTERGGDHWLYLTVVHCWGTDWTVDQLSLQHLQS